MTVEICSECHPFYTGKEKLVDTAGRVEKFRTRRQKAADTKSAKVVKKPAKKTSPKKTINKKAEPKKKATARKKATKK